MKVKLLVDCDGPNPAFNRRKPVGPDNERTRTVPAGTEIEDPHAGYLCLAEPETEEVRAEPLDEEAKAFVAEKLAQRAALLEERRKQQLERARQKTRARQQKQKRRGR